MSSVITQIQDGQVSTEAADWCGPWSPGPGKVEVWPSLMADVQPSIVCFRKRFEVNNLFFLSKRQCVQRILWFTLQLTGHYNDKAISRRNSISNESLLLATNLPVLSGPQTSTLTLLLLWFHRENHLSLERNRTEQSKTRCLKAPVKGTLWIMSTFYRLIFLLPACLLPLSIYISLFLS